MSALADKDEGKYRIVNNINVIGIDPFADQGGALVCYDLPYPQDLHEDQVDVTFLAHFAPGFPIVVVLVAHDGTRPLQMPVVEAVRFGRRELFGGVGSQRQLDKADYAIVDHRDELSFLALPDPGLLRFLQGPDAAGFDVELVGNRDGAQHTPGGAI